MISFMVIAAPRSGTAWCSNWLTTERTHCIHDPLMNHHYSEWDHLAVGDGKKLGIACTGIAIVAPHVLKAHPAKKLVLHRSIHEINLSCRRLGLGPLAPEWEYALSHIPGMHCHWTDLFEKPEHIWVYLTGTPFDAERHAALKRLHVEIEPRRAHPDPAVWQRLKAEIQGVPA